jgi:hypothetical protein
MSLLVIQQWKHGKKVVVTNRTWCPSSQIEPDVPVSSQIEPNVPVHKTGDIKWVLPRTSGKPYYLLVKDNLKEVYWRICKVWLLMVRQKAKVADPTQTIISTTKVYKWQSKHPPVDAPLGNLFFNLHELLFVNVLSSRT